MEPPCIPTRLNPSPCSLNTPTQDLAESREEMGRLQSLIERLGASRSSTVSAAPLASIQAALLKARVAGGAAGR